MVGIYKITNTINQKVYIGQSKQIEKRWMNHRVAAFNQYDEGYEYPLYRAIRKYGLENFQFSVLEECSIDNLNDREKYWINYYDSCFNGYNQTLGGEYTSVPQKLTPAQVREIQEILIADVDGNVSHAELGRRYGVSGKDTIRDINVGRTWYNPEFTYPLHYSKHDSSNPNRNHNNYIPKSICIDCGKEISKGATRCVQCYAKYIKLQHTLPISREELKQRIRNESFVAIGKDFQVTDNAIRKWCIKYGLPAKRKDIKQISNEDWSNI